MRVSRPGVLLVTLFGVCCICNVKVISSVAVLKVDSVSIDNAASVTYTAGGSAQTITVTLKVSETGGTALGTITQLTAYFAVGENLHDSSTVKSQPFPTATLSIEVPLSSDELQLTPQNIPDLLIDNTNCKQYKYVCVAITGDGAVTSADDYDCLPFGNVVGQHAGTKVCPDLASGLLTITSPSSGVVCTAEPTITFDLHVCEMDGTEGTVEEINVYYTDDDDFDDATKKSTAVPVGLTTAVTVKDGQHTFSGETAKLTDDGECSSYTHVCVVLDIESTDVDSENDHSCIAIALDDRSTYHCPDVAAEDFEIKEPDQAADDSEISYSPSTNTEIEFEIEASAEIEDGTITGVELYFSDNANYYAEDITKSSKFVATEVNPKAITQANNVKVKGKASVKPDGENCEKYTHMCGLLLVSSTDTIADNNAKCILADKDNAGVIDCEDSSAAVIGIAKYSIFGSVVMVLVSHLV